MIYIKVELWPGGDRESAGTIGEAVIANDGTGSEKIGNYDAVLYGKDRKKLTGTKPIRVEGFVRKRRGAWDLIAQVLNNYYYG